MNFNNIMIAGEGVLVSQIAFQTSYSMSDVTLHVINK